MKMGFGKHRDLTPMEVAQHDPDYLRWFLGNPEMRARKPFLTDQIQAALDAWKSGSLPDVPAQPLEAQIQAELNRLRSENIKLQCAAAEARRLRTEIEQLKQENTDMEQSLVALRRSQALGANGSTTVTGMAELWRRCWKKLVMLAHPDRGGDVEIMAVLNEINTQMAKQHDVEKRF